MLVFTVRTLAIALLATLGSTLNAQTGTYVLNAAHLFDGKSQNLINGAVIVVSGNKIQAVGGPIPAGIPVIDLGDAPLLPGFVDAHTHLTQDFETDDNGARLKSLDRTVAEQAIHATVNARKTLLAGFTTVRDVGSNDFIDVGLRNSINAGIGPGPRMLVGSRHRSHCEDGAGFRFELLNHEAGPEDDVVDSPDQARFAVRFNIKYGADVIKTCATGGVLSPTDAVDAPQLTHSELHALVAAAHDLNRKTAAHAHGPEGAKRAIRVGIDSIEHGTFLDDDALRMMRERGTYLVPTLSVRSGIAESKFLPLVQQKADVAIKAQDAMVKRALAAGVKIALGTDAAVYPHGVAADLLGLAFKVGTLDAGKLADIVAVPGNPLSDIRLTQSVLFMMRQGTVYRNDRAAGSKKPEIH